MTLQTQIDYLISSIEKGGYDASHMSTKLDEAITEVREITFKYQAKTVHPDVKEHLNTFTSYGKQNKSRLIATLEDTKREISSKQPNNKVMLSWLNKILKTNFYAEALQKKILLEKAILNSRTVLQNEIVVVN